MNSEKKNQLEKLKRKNKEFQKKMELQSNMLLQECLKAMETTGLLLDEADMIQVYNRFIEKTPFLPWGIDWEKITIKKFVSNPYDLLALCEEDKFYIIWGDKLPIIKSDLNSIIKNLSDIVAVEFDTYLISESYNEIVEFHHEGKIFYGKL